MFRFLLICLLLFTCSAHAAGELEALIKDAEQGSIPAQSLLDALNFSVEVNPADEEARLEAGLEAAKTAAEQGYNEEQLLLGFMYVLGAGVPKDDAKAVHWFRKAAEQGNIQAHSYLSFLYANYIGFGIPEDDAKAVYLHWYRKATEQGDAWAQYNLGLMYANGEGVPEDDAKAMHWYRKAAEQGHASAQHFLGQMYSNGVGVPGDDIKAIHWYERAAYQGHARAMYDLGVMLFRIDEAQKLARVKTAAEQGDAWAQFYLDLMYDNGEGVPEDDAKDVHWFRKAAEQGNVQAQFYLGLMYANGEGVPEDAAKAVHWYRRAAEQGDAWAQFYLGLMYSNGEGVPEDHVQAYAWLDIAAAQGDFDALRAKENSIDIIYMTSAQIAEAQKLAHEYWESYVMDPRLRGKNDRK